ncbi:hypothetical protein P2318_17160 [Myxococcaceae bacterium GXIMD 01537]
MVSGCTAAPPDAPPVDDASGRVSAQEHDVWKPCGSTASLLRDIWPGVPGSDPADLTKGDNLLFFTADDGVHGRELWKSTGPGGAGTKRVKDILPGSPGSEPMSLTLVGSTLFFAANDGVSGRELWKSDGTSSGTKRVKDIRPGALGSAPESLLAFKGKLYFSADDGVHGRELWKSDGTSSGTRMVVDFFGAGSLNPGRLTRFTNDVFVFTADESTEAFDALWRSDGTASGTYELDSGPDIISELTPAGDVLFYIGNDEGEESLRVTDGTHPGRNILLDAFPRRLGELEAVGPSRIFFSFSGLRSATELWKSDGTPAGTVLVKDVGSVPMNLTNFGGRLFFTAADAEHGRELWVSDGTADGTQLFKDLAPGPFSSAPEALTVINGTLFFSAVTPAGGREPWVSDGTPEGTRPLTEIAPGSASSTPLGFVRSGWDVFFSAEDGSHGRELWALPFRPEDECNRTRWPIESRAGCCEARDAPEGTAPPHRGRLQSVRASTRSRCRSLPSWKCISPTSVKPQRA